MKITELNFNFRKFKRDELEEAIVLIKTNSFIYSITIDKFNISMKFFVDGQEYVCSLELVYDAKSDSISLKGSNCSDCAHSFCKHAAIGLAAYNMRKSKMTLTQTLDVMKEIVGKDSNSDEIDEKSIESMLNKYCGILDTSNRNIFGYSKYNNVTQTDFIKFFSKTVFKIFETFNRKESMYAVTYLALHTLALDENSYYAASIENTFESYFASFIRKLNFTSEEIYSIFKDIFSREDFKKSNIRQITLIGLFDKSKEEIPLKEAFVEVAKQKEGDAYFFASLFAYSYAGPTISKYTPVSFYALFIDSLRSYYADKRFKCEESLVEDMYRYVFKVDDFDLITKTTDFLMRNLCFTKDYKLTVEALNIILEKKPSYKETISVFVSNFYKIKSITVRDYMAFHKFVDPTTLDQIITHTAYEEDIYKFHLFYTKQELKDKFKVTMFTYEEYAYLAEVMPDEYIEVVKNRMTSKLDKSLSKDRFTDKDSFEALNALKFLDKRFPKLCESYLMNKKLESLFMNQIDSEEFLALAEKNHILEKLGYSVYGG